MNLQHVRLHSSLKGGEGAFWLPVEEEDAFDALVRVWLGARFPHLFVFKIVKDTLNKIDNLHVQYVCAFSYTCTARYLTILWSTVILLILYYINGSNNLTCTEKVLTLHCKTSVRTCGSQNSCSSSRTSFFLPVSIQYLSSSRSGTGLSHGASHSTSSTMGTWFKSVFITQDKCCICKKKKQQKFQRD